MSLNRRPMRDGHRTSLISIIPQLPGVVGFMNPNVNHRILIDLSQIQQFSLALDKFPLDSSTRLQELL